MYGSQTIDVEIVRRERSTLEIAVEPDNRVVATVPMTAPLAKIATKIRKRAPWIRRQQRFFVQFLPRTPKRRYVAGETHLYLGRQYRLKVRTHRTNRVKLSRGLLLVQTTAPIATNRTRTLVSAWYRERAQVRFADRLELCLDRFRERSSFRPKTVLVREMRQRWGSMSPSGRLTLNTRLIEAPIEAIDYVITHELCHMQEPHHGVQFFKLLERVMPDWERRKMRLEKAMA
jgi:predicted metal-dependent hydrolase